MSCLSPCSMPGSLQHYPARSAHRRGELVCRDHRLTYEAGAAAGGRPPLRPGPTQPYVGAVSPRPAPLERRRCDGCADTPSSLWSLSGWCDAQIPAPRVAYWGRAPAGGGPRLRSRSASASWQRSPAPTGPAAGLTQRTLRRKAAARRGPHRIRRPETQRALTAAAPRLLCAAVWPPPAAARVPNQPAWRPKRDFRQRHCA